MRKLTVLALIVTALTAVLALGTATAAARTTVVLGDNFFSPAQKTIAAGTKVRFKWTGVHPHNVTKKSGPGGSFASQTTRAQGVNFVKKFRKPGIYRLYCTIHPLEMNLKLTVTR